MAIREGGRVSVPTLVGVAALLLVAAILGVRHFFPKATEPEPREYVGEPMTGCAFPVDTLDLNKLMRYADEGDGMATHWDEFSSLAQAEDAGYHACESGHP
jgi:hypothetical protein